MAREQDVSLQIAPIVRRFAAFVVDALFLIVSFLAAGSTLVELGVDVPSVFALMVAGHALYYIGFTVYWSSTPGKMAAGLYVSDQAGAAIRPDTAILRYLASFVVGITIIGPSISALMLVTDRQHRAIHDRVAKTLVLVGRPAYEEARWR